jgi:hypothetical protein
MKGTELTTNDIAERYQVAKRVARRWCEEGRFPHAYQLPITIGRGQAWLVPESDLEDFVPPKIGRPLAGNPSTAALKRREQRARDKS